MPTVSYRIHHPVRHILVAGATSLALICSVPLASADPVDAADLLGEHHEHDGSEPLGAHGDHFAENVLVADDPFVIPRPTSTGPRALATDPQSWIGVPPDIQDVPEEWRRGFPAEAVEPSTGRELMSADTGYLAQFAELDTATTGARLAFAPVPPPPSKALPATLDAFPGWQYSYSCDPNDRPGIVAFGQLVGSHYGRPRFHTSRACVAGNSSQHSEGRAVDWPMNVYDADDKAIGDAVAQWLTARNGEMARRFGIMHIIWNKRIWYTHRPTTWSDYIGPSPHTDHLHFSFSWDGAMKRTSWWTGTAVTAVDHGTCRVYSGQYAPRYTRARTAPCPTTLPAPPSSSYPVVLPNASNTYVSIAQGHLGFTGAQIDGSFGAGTLTALMSYQSRYALPVTGVLDNATWATMTTPAPQTPYTQIVASPDLTGDAVGDVAVVDAGGRLHVYQGTGTGRLGSARSFGKGWSTLSVSAPGDWNGDGPGDLVAVDGTGLFWLYPGDGAGGFGVRSQIGNGWTDYRIIPAGDVNTDGTTDLLAIDGDGSLWLYPGRGDGRFGKPVQVGNGWTDYQLHAAGDMNADGRVDILGIDADGKLWFYAGKGSGFFRAKVQVGHGWNGFAFASGGDFNGDGLNDLIGRDPDTRLWFYAGRPGGTFAGKVQIWQGW